MVSPNLTVVIPTYNRPDETKRAILSARLPSHDPEIIVVDDSSPVAFQFPGVLVIRLNENSGPGVARKEGVEAASCQMIAFLDSDDCYEKGWLVAVDTALSKVPLVNFPIVILGKTEGFSGHLNRIVDVLSVMAPTLRLTLTRLIVCFFNFASTSSTVISRNICRFASNLRYCEDYFTFAYAVFSARRIIMLNRNGSCIYRRPNSVGGLTSHRKDMILGELLVKKWIVKTKSICLSYRCLAIYGILYTCVRSILKGEFSYFIEAVCEVKGKDIEGVD